MTKYPTNIEEQLIKEEDRSKYQNSRVNAISILEPWREINHKNDWRISLDECYAINLYSKIPFKEVDLKQFFNACGEFYSFEVIGSEFSMYVVRARFHLKI